MAFQALGDDTIVLCKIQFFSPQIKCCIYGEIEFMVNVGISQLPEKYSKKFLIYVYTFGEFSR